MNSARGVEGRPSTHGGGGGETEVRHRGMAQYTNTNINFYN